MRGRVDYEKEYYCAYCGNKVKQGEEVYHKDANPRCPRDGRSLRRIPRNKRNG